ncbi:PREDICTED: adhesive plaque matrix protein-like isoform X1 [Dufourea novaeangliae]|uniref:adhesive plaque matrix protein-like isoform X1 n=1 Tax=Dufourea novaeangliae TaxID=178035 RepID=UPI000767639E|nr:PREDICTED: adhesive plaque matrix protein-like isoform X1 [Dufourea novaeangliae]
MGGIIQLLILTVLCASVGKVQGECRHVNNDDMIEYSCVGGQLSDLNDLPESTGKIRISSMPVSRITTDTFARFGSELWVLGCSDCGITDIEPGALQHLTNLQQLSLDNNHLTTIKEPWFRGLNYLTYLDLNYNNIETIDDGVFKNLPSLVDLRLSGNRLQCLNIGALTNLKDLKRMFLTENSEFKCPNAVSTYLEKHGVSFERDPEWNRITKDLVPADITYEYDIDYDSDYDDTTTVPITTPLPAYRERLHLTPVTPVPVESTPSYVPQRLQTTEEVVYRPVYETPDWRTIPRPRPTSPSIEEERTTMGPSYEDTKTYHPPRTILPLDIDTYPPNPTTPLSVDETTLRSWPRFPESTSARPEFPLYPPHENEDQRYEQPYYSSEASSPFPLAPGPAGDQETSPFAESNVEHTTDEPYKLDWQERNTVSWDNYPIVDTGPPEYRVPPTDDSGPTHVVRPLPPEMIQPASPDNVYQPPYYQHTVTVHGPPSASDPRTIMGAEGVQTTTDKPLPNCPNSSSPFQRSISLLVVTVLMVLVAGGFVEGF